MGRLRRGGIGSTGTNDILWVTFDPDIGLTVNLDNDQPLIMKECSCFSYPYLTSASDVEHIWCPEAFRKFF